MSKILIGEKQYNHHWVSDPENSNAQNLLRRHHQSLNRPTCCCFMDAKNRELTIKKRNRFFLARMPGTGENHAPWCEFFGENSFSTENGGTLPAIIEQNGIWDINLSSPLSVSTDLNKTAEISHHAGINRSTTTLLGLLNFLFEKAETNVWRPNRKFDQSFSHVRKLVSEVSKKTVIDKTRVSRRLFIPEWLDNNLNASLESNQKNISKKTPQGTAAIVIGKINAWIESKKTPGGMGVGLNLLNDPLWMEPELAAKTIHSFGQLISEIRKKDRHILAICSVFKTGKYYTIGDIALMRVSKQFIPVDSSYELAVADRLVEEKRFFCKPIRSIPLFLEQAGFLPDFVLTDCKHDWVMEVFGIDNDPEYLAQKGKKLAYYREHTISCWQWTPKDNTGIPKFPDRS